MVFLDYASTNPYTKFPCSKYGQFLNPNANYAHREKQLLHDCEERIKRAIGAKSGKVLFGGTSSQLIENVMTRVNETTPLFTVYSSVYEHNSFDRYAEVGFNNIDGFEATLQNSQEINMSGPNEWKPIVFHQAIQNITGQIFDVKKIGELCHKYGAFYICDTTALWGHTALPDGIDDWCDMIVIDGHKEATELGIGCMWLSQQLNDWLNDMTLHGTPNLAGALAICDATEWAVKDTRKNISNSVNLYCWLKTRLEAKGIKFVNVNGEAKWGEWCPCINAIRLIGINADALQQYAASKDCYISIGASACQEIGNYRVLEQGYGLSHKEASEVIRVSFGENTTYEDVNYLVSIIKEFEELFA